MVKVENEEKIISALLRNESALKPNVAELMRTTGLSRNTIHRAFESVWPTAKVRFVFPNDESRDLERALVAIKLVQSKRSFIDSIREKLLQIHGLCEVLVVEGRDTDLIAKLIAQNPTSFSNLLFDIKELDYVESAEVAFRILQECQSGYSEHSITELD